MTSRTLRLVVAPVLAALTFVGCATDAPPADDTRPGSGGKGDSPDSTCEDYTDSDACAAAGCEWWPGSIANDRPDLCLAPPTCEDYTDSDACAAAGCEWWPGSIANDRPDVCLAP